MSAGDWKDMFSAASVGDLDLVKYHIRNGVNPNYQHPEILSTVLVTAIIAGHIDIVKFLLENGADPNLESDFDQLTPIKAAKLHKRTEIIEILGPRLAEEKKPWFKRLFSRD